MREPDLGGPAQAARRVDQASAVIALRVLGERVTSELRTRMRQLPMRLRGSGLAATYAFVLSKADPQGEQLARSYYRLAEQIASHVANQGLLSGTGRQMDPLRFLQALGEANVHDYARVSVEVEVLAVWLSRLAEALCEDQDSGDDPGEGEGGGARGAAEG